MGMPAHMYLRCGDGNTVMPGASLYYSLGRLMAFDMLINNFDRLPLAWSNDGNLGNVMLGASQGPVVGIDQCVTPIKHPNGLHMYLDRVKDVVAEARGSPMGKSRFAAVKEAIHVNTGIDLGKEELYSMRAGVLAFMTEMAALCVAGALEEKLQAVSREVADIAATLPPRLDETGLHAGPPPVEEFSDLVRKVVAA